MRLLWSFRYVRAIPIHEWFIALVFLGVYLAAEEYGVPYGATSLGFAVTLHFGLSIFANLLFMSAGRFQVLRSIDIGITAIALGIVALTAVFATLLSLDEANVLLIWCALNLGQCGIRLWNSRDMKLIADEAAAFRMRRADVSAWNLMKAFQLIVLVTTTLAIFEFAGSFATVLFIGFGALFLRFFSDWTLLLYFWSRRA